MLKAILFAISSMLISTECNAAQYKGMTSEKLANGITVVCVDTTKSADAFVALCISSGCADELRVKGIANLLNQVLLQQLKEEFSANDKLRGAEIKCVTDYDYSIFYIYTTYENINECIKCISNGLTNLALKESVVEELKKRTIQQIKDHNQVDTAFLRSEAKRALFFHATYGDSTSGTADSVSNITLSDLIAFKNTNYHADRITVIATSKGKKQQLIDLLSTNFPKAETTTINRLAEPLHNSSTVEIAKNSKQAHVSIIEMFWKLPCYKESPGEALAADIFIRHLEKALSDTLIKQQKIVVTISLEPQLWNHSDGYLRISFTISNNIDLELAKTAILSEVKSAASLSMSNEQIAAISKQLSNEMKFSNANSIEVISLIAPKLGAGHDISFIKEFPTFATKIEKSSVDAACKIFKRYPQVISVLKPE